MIVTFRTPRLLGNPHLQTLGAALPSFERARAPEALRIPLSIERGTRPYALHASASFAPGRAPVVLVVHGIGGSARSPYVVRAARAAAAMGFHVVRLDLRGAGASVPDVPSLYHAGLTDDVAHAAEHLARDPRVDGVTVLGFSGGGALGLALASAWGDAAPPWARAIVSVSAPLDYTEVGMRMERLAALPYRFHVLRGLVAAARAFAIHHPERAPYKAHEVARFSTFREYDGRVVVPMHGFADVDDYWSKASVGPRLGGIRVPTLLLHAEDDPMVPGDTVRPWLAGASRAVEVMLTPRGGHLGWVDGEGCLAWPLRRGLDFLALHATTARAEGRGRT